MLLVFPLSNILEGADIRYSSRQAMRGFQAFSPNRKLKAGNKLLQQFTPKEAILFANSGTLGVQHSLPFEMEPVHRHQVTFLYREGRETGHCGQITRRFP